MDTRTRYFHPKFYQCFTDHILPLFYFLCPHPGGIHPCVVVERLIEHPAPVFHTEIPPGGSQAHRRHWFSDDLYFYDILICIFKFYPRGFFSCARILLDLPLDTSRSSRHNESSPPPPFCLWQSLCSLLAVMRRVVDTVVGNSGPARGIRGFSIFPPHLILLA